MRSIVLFGSAAAGGYLPGRSDIDVCTIVEGGISQELGDQIGRLHDEMWDLFVVRPPTGGQTYRYVIEGPYIPAEMVANSCAIGDCYKAYGRTRKWIHGNPISAFDRYSLSHSGIRLYGIDLKLAPPTRDELVKQLHDDLNNLTRPTSECLVSPGWLATMIIWIARSIAFWRDGVVLHKQAAVEQEIARGTPFADAYRLALSRRLAEARGEQASDTITAELRDQFLCIAPKAIEILTRLAAIQTD
jgi:hypothetical protein